MSTTLPSIRTARRVDRFTYALRQVVAEARKVEQSGRTVFRVRLGPFTDKAMAEATREQLEVNGVEAALVRVQK